MARAALEVNHDDALGLAPAGAAFAERLTGRRRLGAQAEERAEGAAENGRAADAEEVAPGDAEVSVAEVAAGLSRDADHRLWEVELSLWSECLGRVCKFAFASARE